MTRQRTPPGSYSLDEPEMGRQFLLPTTATSRRSRMNSYAGWTVETSISSNPRFVTLLRSSREKPSPPMRDKGEYFAVEQLRLHANALLALVDDNTPMPSLSPQYARVYTYAKTLLQAELS